MLSIIPDFTSNVRIGLNPLTIQFIDLSRGYVTGWLWSYDGVTSISKTPTYTFTTAGTYTITLTITNNLTSKTKTKINYITVLDVAPTIITTSQSIIPSIELRCRAFQTLSSAHEIYLGPTPGSGGFPNRVQQNLTWTQNNLNPFTLNYNPISDTMVFACNSTTTTYSPVNPNVVVINAVWDTMRIYIANRDIGTTVNIRNLLITENDTSQNYAIGDLIGTNGFFLTWHINFQWSGNWTISGDIELGGSFGGSQELSKIGFIPGEII
tara:strand:+ start:136611 stop:137411 length:801 start_codon:yes stop_codon:yes gene_type:complete